MIDIKLLAEVLINGFLLGGVYAVIAIGLNLIFGVSGIIQLAYGDMAMIGMYVIYWLIVLYHANLSVSALASILVLIGISGVLQKAMFDRLLDAPELNQILATGGLVVLLESLAQLLWGADYRTVKVAFPVFRVSGISISLSKLVIFVVSVLCLGLLYIFLSRTYEGRAIRAVAQDKIGAALIGINLRRTYLVAACVGGALIGIAAACLVLIYSIYPQVGLTFTTLAFVIVVFGGLGNMLGALVGSFIISETMMLSAVFVGLELAEAITFAIFIVILIFRPHGILGRRM